MSKTSRMTTELPARPVRLTWRSAVMLVSVFIAFLVLRGAFVAAHRVLGWAVACIAVAVFVDPLVEALGRFIPRVLAVILTFVLFGAAAGVLVFGVVDDLDQEVGRLQDVAPQAIQDLEGRNDEIGRLAEDLELSGRTETFLRELDDRVGSGSGALAENAPSAPVYFVCAILTIFLLVYGPAMARGAARQIDDADRREVVVAVLERAAHRSRRTVSALLTQGMLVLAATTVAAMLLDLPAPIVLGMIAGVAAMLPDVGIIMGAFPTVALTAAFHSILAAVLVAVAAFGIQLFEAWYIRRRIREFGVDVGPAVIWIVALVGYTLYGPGMAFYGVLYAIFALAVIDQVPAARARARAT